jgi:hypothetical protein
VTVLRRRNELAVALLGDKKHLALELLRKGCEISDLTDRNLPIPSLQDWRKDRERFEDEKQTRLHKEFGGKKRGGDEE